MTAQVARPSHPSRRAFWLPFLVWLVFALGLHWAAPMLNAVNILGFPLAYYLAGQGALIAFAMLGFWASAAWRQPAGPGAALAGLSTAGIWMSGALPVALAGALYAYGYDGLSFVLGLSGGFLLVACNVAPAFSKSGVATLTQFLAIRTGGRLAVWAATMMTAVSLILIVSAEFEFVRRIAAPLFAGGHGGTGIAALAAVFFAAIAVAHFRDSTAIWLQAAAYLLILVAVIAAAAVMSLIAFDGAIPHLTYGLGLRDLANLERSLVLEGLSDPSLVRPFVKPNTSFSLENFLAISLSMMLGVAAMSMVMKRWTTAATGPAPLPQASAWALFFAALMLITLPAVAVFAKLDIYTAVASGVTADSAPPWLKQQTFSATTALCPQGCADPAGRLHVGDIAIDPEAILPSAPLIARLPGYAVWSFVALLAFAAILSAGSIIATLTRMLADAPPDGCAPGGLSTRPLGRGASFAAAAALAAAAAVIAVSLKADLMTRISWSASLAASGLFPMLFLAAVWPRASSPGLAAGGLAGFAMALYYIAGTQLFPLHFLDLWQDYSNMPPWRFEALEEVRQNCRDAVDGACGEAHDMARDLANWWGLDTRAAGIIGAPVGLAFASVFSLLHVAFRRTRAQA